MRKQQPAGFGKPIFIGNNCFGRNTYGGGKYDIYKAANKIISMNCSQLRIALFAPGFTYENNALQDRQKYHLNEAAMYNGVTSEIIPILAWTNVVNRGNGWKKQGDWAVTSYEMCEREFRYRLKKMTNEEAMIKIQFRCIVSGTPPNCADPYKIVMQLIDSRTGTLYHENNPTKFSIACDKEQKVSAQIQFESVLLTCSEQVCIRVVEMGKDVQHWGGHYGVRFKKEQIVLQVYQKEKHWSNKIPIKSVQVGTDQYHSYCNIGFGDHFHYFGIKKQQNYNYLQDEDIPHCTLLNLPTTYCYNYKQAFMGGTSLQIKTKQFKLLQVQMRKLALPCFLSITLKDAKLQHVRLINPKTQKQSTVDRIINHSETISQSGWTTFIGIFQSNAAVTDQPWKYHILIQTDKEDYLLGEIRLGSKEKQKLNESSIGCSIALAKGYMPTQRYYIDLEIIACFCWRILVTIGESFSGFCYCEGGRAYLRKIQIPKCNSLSIKLQEVDQTLTPVLLLSSQINNADLLKLIIHGKLTLFLGNLAK